MRETKTTNPQEEQRVITAEVHIRETQASTPEDRRFECWTNGEAAKWLDQLAQTVLETARASDPAISSLRANLTPREAIAYAVQIERLAWRWNLSARNNHTTKIELTRIQDLRF